jgi:hypothetical protein
VPAVSNDITAIRTLAANGLTVPSPVLRSMDLWVFARQIGLLDEKDCNDIRRVLIAEGEILIPRAFQNASFDDALATFRPRLVDGDRSMIGRPASGLQAHELLLIVREV